MRIWPDSECPTCKAGRCEACRTRSGKAMKPTQVHAARPKVYRSGESPQRQIEVLR